MNTLKQISKGLIYFLLIMLIIINIFMIISKVILKSDYPNFFGYTWFEIASNSMYPELKKGDLVIIKLNQKDYKVGDIITFQDDYFYTTHRLVEINNTMYTTKGDNNNTNDKPISKTKVIGKVILKVAAIGYFIYIIKQPITIILLLVATILINLKNN